MAPHMSQPVQKVAGVPSGGRNDQHTTGMTQKLNAEKGGLFQSILLVPYSTSWRLFFFPRSASACFLWILLWHGPPRFPLSFGKALHTLNFRDRGLKQCEKHAVLTEVRMGSRRSSEAFVSSAFSGKTGTQEWRRHSHRVLYNKC